MFWESYSSQLVGEIVCYQYSCCKKSCTTWHAWSPVNNRTWSNLSISFGAIFLPSAMDSFTKFNYLCVLGVSRICFNLPLFCHLQMNFHVSQLHSGMGIYRNHARMLIGRNSSETIHWATLEPNVQFHFFLVPGKHSIHSFRPLWLVLGVTLMEINSNLFSR